MRIITNKKTTTTYGAEGFTVTVLEVQTEVGSIGKTNIDIQLHKEESGATIYFYSSEQVEAAIALLQEALGQVRGK